jgi:hypothetical protein
MIRDSNKIKYNLSLCFFFFCLNEADTKNKKMNNANTKKLKGTLKKYQKDMTLFRSLALIPTNANLVITLSRNPQSRLRFDPGEPKKVW